MIWELKGRTMVHKTKQFALGRVLFKPAKARAGGVSRLAVNPIAAYFSLAE